MTSSNPFDPPKPAGSCAQCGAPLAPGSTICTVCGATANVASDASGPTETIIPPSQMPSTQPNPSTYPPAGAAYPAPGTAYPYGAPQPVAAPQWNTAYAQRPTNTLAIVALVLGIVTGIGGIICGHIALGQIKRTGEGGRGLAIAGLVIGYVLTGIVLLYIIVVVVLIATFANSYSSYGLALTALSGLV